MRPAADAVDAAMGLADHLGPSPWVACHMVRNSGWGGGSISLHPSGPAALLSVPAKELPAKELVSRPLNLRRRRAGAGPAGRPHLQPRRRHRPGQATPACWSDCWAQPGLDRGRAPGLAASRSERAANDQYDHSGSVGSIRM